MQARADWPRGEQARGGQSRLPRSRQCCLARGPAVSLLSRSEAVLCYTVLQNKVFLFTTPKLGIPAASDLGRQRLARPLLSAQEPAFPLLTRGKWSG